MSVHVKIGVRIIERASRKREQLHEHFVTRLMYPLIWSILVMIITIGVIVTFIEAWSRYVIWGGQNE